MNTRHVASVILPTLSIEVPHYSRSLYNILLLSSYMFIKKLLISLEK